MGPRSWAFAGECACVHTYTCMRVPPYRAFFKLKREEGNVGDLSALDIAVNLMIHLNLKIPTLLLHYQIGKE